MQPELRVVQGLPESVLLVRQVLEVVPLGLQGLLVWQVQMVLQVNKVFKEILGLLVLPEQMELLELRVYRVILGLLVLPEQMALQVRRASKEIQVLLVQMVHKAYRV